MRTIIMKIVSWNINGLRATLKSVSGPDLASLLDGMGADIICFQETKATRDESLYLVDGYNAYFSFCQTKKGYSGVVTFCRNSATPISAEEGLTGILSSGTDSDIKGYGDLSTFTEEELSLLDCEGRAVLTEHCFSGKTSDRKDTDLEGVDRGGVGHAPANKSDNRRMVIVNVYCPMYDPARDEKGEGLSRLQYKMNFYRLLEARCTALEQAGKEVLAVGDFNCSREAIDSAYWMDDPSLSKGSQSRDWMRQFAVTKLPSSPSITHTLFSSPSSSTTHQTLSSPTHQTRSSPAHHTSPSSPLLDTFRYLHPTQEGAYTCWSTLLDARKTNYGTRIDYILSSLGLASDLAHAEVWQHVQGSDHCPVFAEFNLSFFHSGSVQLPSLCSCWFSGKQTKLSDFVTRRTTKAKSRGVADATAKEKVTIAEKEISVAGARGSTDRGVKRTKDVAEPPPPKRTLGQKSLLSFSSHTPQATPPKTECESAPAAQARGELNASWKTVFGCSPKAPPCSGHREACVLRKVKKSGPNKDRQFWVCARPGGSKGDPQARCNFFEWVKEKKK